MGVAVWALIVYIALIIFWVVALKRNIGEAMIVSFFVSAIFGGLTDLPNLLWNGFIFGATHEVLFAAMSFVFMAFLIEQTGIIQRLISILNSLLGRLPGGAGYVDTIASALFGSVSGSGSGNTASVGAITIPWMIRTNWPKHMSATVAAGNAGLGISFPPSGSVFILLGMATVAASVSEGQLFIALYVAGIYTLGYRLLLTWWFVKKHKIDAVDPTGILPIRQSLTQGWKSMLIFLGIIIPVAVTIGPLSDFFAGNQRIGEDAVDAISILTWVPILIIMICLAVGRKALPSSIKGWSSYLQKAVKGFSTIGVILLFAFAASDVLNELGLSDHLGSLMASADLPLWGIIALVGVLIVLVATPLTATATVTAVGLVAFTALTSAGVDPVVATVAILVFASTEGASPPGAAPIMIASSIADENPTKTFIPLIVYYVIPITIIGLLIGVGWLPVPTG
ncbi:TRAP transporter large permease subunit [Shouchella shacheensis]|uniref:TRAP transporter large permease subunit n=1 Tax=Shouchella shacheensis TaxID=1649580 RepID=UPI00073FC344|nr:TRAP transporter large permease subunit [Shouchella shacheensis]